MLLKTDTEEVLEGDITVVVALATLELDELAMTELNELDVSVELADMESEADVLAGTLAVVERLGNTVTVVVTRLTEAEMMLGSGVVTIVVLWPGTVEVELDAGAAVVEATEVYTGEEDCTTLLPSVELGVEVELAEEALPAGGATIVLLLLGASGGGADGETGGMTVEV